MSRNPKCDSVSREVSAVAYLRGKLRVRKVFHQQQFATIEQRFSYLLNRLKKPFGIMEDISDSYAEREISGNFA